MSAQGFQGMRQAIKGVGGQQQAVEQQSVGRHGGIAQARPLHGNQEEHRLQRQGADKYVAIDGQQRSPVQPAAQRGPVQRTGIGPQCAPRQVQTEQCTAPFGNHRGPGRAGHAPVQAEHEQ